MLGWQRAAAELHRCWVVVSGRVCDGHALQGWVLRSRVILLGGHVRWAVYVCKRLVLCSGKRESCGRVLLRRFLLQRRQRAPDRVRCGGLLLRGW